MSARSVVQCLLVLVLVTTAFAPLATAANGDVTINSFTYSGDGAVATPQQPQYLWQSASQGFTVVLGGNRSGAVDVCLTTQLTNANRSTGLGCKAATLTTGESTTVTLSLDAWPANFTGQQDVRVVVTDKNATTGVPLAQQSLSVVVVKKNADPDGDGLTNQEEVSAGTKFFVADSDGDGLSDGLEVKTYHTDPNKVDTDGDGLSDGKEVNDYQTNPTSPDTDHDGLTDDLELKDGTNPNKADTDGDGLGDAAEVNTYHTNPNKADTDGDGLGDAEEVNKYGTNPNKADTDGDGLTDGQEVNVFHTDPNKADTDGDGLGDAAEINRYHTDPTKKDTDGDGLDDGEEVNKYGTNPNKADTDGDGRSDGAEVKAGTNPTKADTPPPGSQPPVTTREVVGGLFVLAGLAIVVIFLFVRRSGVDGVLARLPSLRRGSGGTESGGDDVPSAAGEPAVEPPPIPTNQGRVLELLEEHGGRMLQSDIVEHTDWSKSKVSRVLSDMDEEGDIVKIDVGKGNLIALPEVAPPGSRPPSDRRE